MLLFKSLAKTKTKHNPVIVRSIQLHYHSNSPTSIYHTILFLVYIIHLYLYIHIYTVLDKKKKPQEIISHKEKIL